MAKKLKLETPKQVPQNTDAAEKSHAELLMNSDLKKLSDSLLEPLKKSRGDQIKALRFVSARVHEAYSDPDKYGEKALDRLAERHSDFLSLSVSDVQRIGETITDDEWDKIEEFLEKDTKHSYNGLSVTHLNHLSSVAGDFRIRQLEKCITDGLTVKTLYNIIHTHLAQNKDDHAGKRNHVGPKARSLFGKVVSIANDFDKVKNIAVSSDFLERVGRIADRDRDKALVEVDTAVKRCGKLQEEVAHLARRLGEAKSQLLKQAAAAEAAGEQKRQAALEKKSERAAKKKKPAKKPAVKKSSPARKVLKKRPAKTEAAKTEAVKKPAKKKAVKKQAVKSTEKGVEGLTRQQLLARIRKDS